MQEYHHSTVCKSKNVELMSLPDSIAKSDNAFHKGMARYRVIYYKWNIVIVKPDCINLTVST